jgi:hypothetical protein
MPVHHRLRHRWRRSVVVRASPIVLFNRRHEREHTILIWVNLRNEVVQIHLRESLISVKFTSAPLTWLKYVLHHWTWTLLLWPLLLFTRTGSMPPETPVIEPFNRLLRRWSPGYVTICFMIFSIDMRSPSHQRCEWLRLFSFFQCSSERNNQENASRISLRAGQWLTSIDSSDGQSVPLVITNLRRYGCKSANDILANEL